MAVDRICLVPVEKEFSVEKYHAETFSAMLQNLRASIIREILIDRLTQSGHQPK